MIFAPPLTALLPDGAFAGMPLSTTHSCPIESRTTFCTLMKQVEGSWPSVQFCIWAFGQGFSSLKPVQITTLFGVGPEFRGYLGKVSKI